MKLLNLKKKPSLYKSESVKSASESTGSWFTTDQTEIKQRAAAAQMSSSGRPPEFYLKENEEKTIRLLCSQPIAQFRQYTIKVNGKHHTVTAPPADEDLFAEQGHKARMVFLYVVVDYEGYTDKAGKPHKNLVRYWVVGNRVYQQLAKYHEKLGKLTAADLTISRTGTGTSTVYSIIPSPPSPMPPKAKAAADKEGPELKSEDSLKKHYSPPSMKAQRGLLNV